MAGDNLQDLGLFHVKREDCKTTTSLKLCGKLYDSQVLEDPLRSPRNTIENVSVYCAIRSSQAQGNVTTNTTERIVEQWRYQFQHFLVRSLDTTNFLTVLYVDAD